MRKVVTFLGASLCLAWVVPSFAQTAPDSFKDVPSDHWAYQAVEALRAKGVLVGYPDGFYRGKRTMTRYEFAVALHRALEQLQLTPGPKGDKGDTGAPGEAGQAGPAGAQGDKGEPGSGVSADDLAALKKLADEFNSELASQGVNINALSAKLDKLAKDVAEIKGKLDKMLVPYGVGFMGLRIDGSRNNYWIDADGRVVPHDLKTSPVTVRAFGLGLKGKVGSDGQVDVLLVNDNYSSYVGGNVAMPYTNLNTNPGGTTYVLKAELKAPFSALGRDGNVTLGRFGYNLTPLTLWRIDTDSYFDNPLIDDGKFYMDGGAMNTKFGSVGFQAFAGQVKTVGAGENFSNIAAAGPVDVEQIAGVAATLPVKMGQEGSYIRGIAFAADQKDGIFLTDTVRPASNVAVFGVDANLKLTEKATVAADWAKTLVGTGKLKTLSPSQHWNNAGTASIGYDAGKIKVNAGYKYIDPRYVAPGYWGRIGNFINPTNIQGPSLGLTYALSSAVGLSAGAEYYKPAHPGAGGTISGRDEITRILAGLKWDLSKDFATSLEWENDLASVDTDSGRLHPTQQWLSLGTAYHLTDAAKIKLGYHLGTQTGKGILPGWNYTFNAFTCQTAVKF